MRDQYLLAPSEYETACTRRCRRATASRRRARSASRRTSAPGSRTSSSKRYGTGNTFGGGLKIRTTLDLDYQTAAEQAINGRLAGVGPSAALVAIDNKTGGVRAMVGGSDFQQRPFNLATQGQRQPGSAFKPFTLIAALEKGISPGPHVRLGAEGARGPARRRSR